MTPPVLTVLLPGFVGTELPEWLGNRLRSGLGGVCLFGPNIESLAQLSRLTAAIRTANPRAIIALDEEGGDVTRLYADVGSPSPGNAVLGRVDDTEATRRGAAQIGWELRRTGCTVDFAPCVDVNSRADNPVIGVRSFGADPDRVARHAAAWVSGLQSSGIAATAKHFPGHGDTSEDSHVALPVVDRTADELGERELVPFVAAIEAGARLVMTSHLVVPRLDDEPATMSRAILVDLLRGELGFSGVIVTDALDMAGAQGPGGLGEAAVRSLRAGCDLLCLGTETTDRQLSDIELAVGRALADGSLDPARVQEAGNRVLGLAADFEASRPAIPTPVEQAWTLDVGELVGSFEVSAAAARWPARGSYPVVRIEAQPNMATGRTPWGPFAAAARDPESPRSAAFSARPQFVVTPSDATGEPSSLPPPDAGQPVLVVGRDLHRHGFARAVVDRLRDEHDAVLVVDMGWPSPDRRYADVATYGSSEVLGQALLSYLEGRARDLPHPA